MIHVLEDFEGEENVEVMTADDFITRCYEIGVQDLDQVQIQCLMRVLGKPNAKPIRMMGFGMALPRNELCRKAIHVCAVLK